SFGCDGLPAGDDFEMRCQRVKSKKLARSFAPRCHAIPPDERSAGRELHAGGLLKTGTAKRDQLIGQVFQESAGREADLHMLRCQTFGPSAAVDGGGSP